MAVRQYRREASSFANAAPDSAGENVRVGKDHTLYATTDGRVEFFNGGPQNRKQVRIVTA